MAKSAKSNAVVAGSGIDRDLLNQIVTATAANSFVYTSPTAHQPMLAHVPPLVEVNTTMVDPTDATKFATRATGDAAAFLAATAAEAASANGAPSEAAKPSAYAIITGAVLPEPKKRGNAFGAGAPTKYPFADLPVGGMFFSANTEHAKGDAVKALGSTVSSQNRKYADPVVENGVAKTKKVTRAIRGEDNKAKLGPDGKKLTETVDLPELKYNRKFTIRPVTGGQKYGEWTAPADGALIARTL